MPCRIKKRYKDREGLSCFLQNWLEGITWEGEAPECEIVGLTADSRQLEPGWVYVCQKGQRFDGHDFAAKALELGAAAVVVDRDLGLPRQIRVEDTHAAYPLLCANFFGRPADSMKMIGAHPAPTARPPASFSSSTCSLRRGTAPD